MHKLSNTIKQVHTREIAKLKTPLLWCCEWDLPRKFAELTDLSFISIMAFIVDLSSETDSNYCWVNQQKI